MPSDRWSGENVWLANTSAGTEAATAAGLPDIWASEEALVVRAVERAAAAGIAPAEGILERHRQRNGGDVAGGRLLADLAAEAIAPEDEARIIEALVAEDGTQETAATQALDSLVAHDLAATFRTEVAAARRGKQELSSGTVDFIERLVERHRALRPLLHEHVVDNVGEVLPTS